MSKLARRVAQVRFRCPNEGQPRIIVSFTSGQNLTLESGKIFAQLQRLSRHEKYGKVKAYVIYEMAYEMAMKARNGPSFKVQELLFELQGAVETLGYLPNKMNLKQSRPAKR